MTECGVDKAILLVDDDPKDVELALLALRKGRMPHRVEVARSGTEALQRLFESPEPLPDLVVLDFNMPKVTGADVLKEIRAHERTRLLPVVILTSSVEDKDRRTSYSLGANSYVRKPIDFAEFTRVVSELQSYWLSLNEAPPA